MLWSIIVEVLLVSSQVQSLKRWFNGIDCKYLCRSYRFVCRAITLGSWGPSLAGMAIIPSIVGAVIVVAVVSYLLVKISIT